MSDYDFRPGGALKLKGGVAEGGVKKKKSSKAKAKVDQVEKVKKFREQKDREAIASSTAENTTQYTDGTEHSALSDTPKDRKTAAERRFEEIQRQRRTKKVAKLAAKTHKERVQEFNEKLEALSEHHDIPKVGPG